MNVKTRVKKHREKLRGEQCSRLDVWLAISLIEAVHTLARHQRRPLWEEVQEALREHVTRHPAIIKAPQCSPWEKRQPFRRGSQRLASG
jgi:hypothetical protein